MSLDVGALEYSMAKILLTLEKILVELKEANKTLDAIWRDE